MEVLTATFKVVTPMFIGGADQTPSDGIRPPSVKGALRFWWRALNWGEFYQQENQDKTNALCALHKEEARLFGFAAKTVDGQQVGGQGCFLLTVRHKQIVPTQPTIPKFSGTAYLAGMGLGDRTALPAGKEFSISLRFRPGIDPELIKEMKVAVRVFGLIGSLGSRSRRGFGSIIGLVKNGEGFRLPTVTEIEADCLWLTEKFLSSSTSPFSALDANSLFYRSQCDFLSSDAALEDVGKWMNRYRTNGMSTIRRRDGTIARTASPNHRIVSNISGVGSNECRETDLPFYGTDHHHVHHIASKGVVTPPHNVPPERSIFGLPHPYRFSSLDGRKVSFDYEPSKEKGRRASPLFVHIAAFTDGAGQTQYRPLLLLLQPDFLPQGAKLIVSVGTRKIGTVQAPTDYGPIKVFLSDPKSFVKV